MRYIMFIAIVGIFLLGGCSGGTDKTVTTFPAPVETTTTMLATTTTNLVTTTTSTTTTSTVATTTTTMYVPEGGELCYEVYTEALANFCDVDEDLSFYIVSPSRVECILGTKYKSEDVGFVTIKDYTRSPLLGIDPKRLPIFHLKGKEGYNETGEQSVRYVKDSKMHEVQFVQDMHLVIVQTWDDLEINSKPILCTSEQTLEYAQAVDKNLIKALS